MSSENHVLPTRIIEIVSMLGEKRIRLVESLDLTPLFTIAASLPPDSQGSIFKDIVYSTAAGNGTGIRVRPKVSPTLESKLHTRSWACQEFVLGNRILELEISGIWLYCSSSEVVEEMVGKESGDSGPPYGKAHKGVENHEVLKNRKLVEAHDPVSYAFRYRNTFRGLFCLNDSPPASDIATESWLCLVCHYSGRNLTRLSDPLPALSGLAAMYAKMAPAQE